MEDGITQLLLTKSDDKIIRATVENLKGPGTRWAGPVSTM